MPDFELRKLRYIRHDKIIPTIQKVGKSRLADLGDTPFSPPKEMWLPAASLFVDPIFQRGLNPSWARKIATHFDPDRFDHIKVSTRSDGRLAILDGQHRFAAVELLGWMEQKVPCLVYEGLTIAEEAEIFRSQGDRKPLTVNELHIAAVVAGRHDAVAIQAAIEASGYRSMRTRSKVPDVIDCIGAAYRVAIDSDVAMLQRVLTFLATAWIPRDWQPRPVGLLGMRSFLSRYDELIDAERLTSILTTLSPKDLSYLAEGQRQIMKGAIGTNGARVLTQRYNKQLRTNKLPDWDRSIDG